MYVHGNPWPRRILTQMCPQKSPWDSPLLAGRISHPGMLIVLYSQNRIEIDPAAKDEADIYPMHGAEIYPAKSLGQKSIPQAAEIDPMKPLGADAQKRSLNWGETFVTQMPPEMEFFIPAGGKMEFHCLLILHVACARVWCCIVL